MPLRWWDEVGIDRETANAKGVETDRTDGTETYTEGEEERDTD